MANLPSSFSKAGGAGKPYSPPEAPEQARREAPMEQPGGNSLPILLGVLALAISLASFYGAFFAERPFTGAQKEALAGMATNLKELQNRDISISAPVETTIRLDRSYPIKDLFPEKFDMPLEFSIPIDTQLIGIGASGQPVVFKVDEDVPISVSVPITSADAFGNGTIRIQKELPVSAVFTSSIKVRAAYGKELNEIIDRLEAMAGEPQAG